MTRVSDPAPPTTDPLAIQGDRVVVPRAGTDEVSPPDAEALLAQINALIASLDTMPPHLVMEAACVAETQLLAVLEPLRLWPMRWAESIRRCRQQQSDVSTLYHQQPKGWPGRGGIEPISFGAYYEAMQESWNREHDLWFSVGRAKELHAAYERALEIVRQTHARAVRRNHMLEKAEVEACQSR